MYFITFITEGHPYDNGFNLTDVGEKIKSKLTPYFEKVFVFTKRTLKELDGSEDVCNSYPEPLDNNPNANHVGYFDFKPFLIKDILNKVPQGSLVLYHDGNFQKNPHYFDSDWENIEKISETLLLDNQTDVWVQVEREITLVKEHVKRLTLSEVIGNEDEVNLALNSRLLNAARILVRNTPFAQQFIEDYLSLCLNKKLIQKTPDDNRDPYAKNYCGDQDALNALIYKYIFDGKFIPEFPKYSFGDRVISDNKVIGKDGINRGGKKLLLNENVIEYMKSNKHILNIEHRIPSSPEQFQLWWNQEFKSNL